MKTLPRDMIKELDKYIVGQSDAKRAISISIRNRYRRSQIRDQEIADNITPTNILLIGSTGVGKTEIMRRVASICGYPFLKVDATKFTEIGYVGRDVESIIRDIIEITIKKKRNNSKKLFFSQAIKIAEFRVAEALLGNVDNVDMVNECIKNIRNGSINEVQIKIDVKDNGHDNPQHIDLGGNISMIQLSDVLGKFGNENRKKTLQMSVKDAINRIVEEESLGMIDEDSIIRDALEDTTNNGIIFIDEIDKLISNGNSSSRGEVSREGVQRDLLALLSGTIVSTKYGNIDTRHILFIASGAFHNAKPSDLFPELQGRLPVQIKLNNLKISDFYEILKLKTGIISNITSLLKVDNIDISFDDDALIYISEICHSMNTELDNIGARRLSTIIEKIVEDVSFNSRKCKLIIDKEYAKKALKNFYIHKFEKAKFII